MKRQRDMLSRAATMLLMMLFTTISAWAGNWDGGTHTATANEVINATVNVDNATLTINAWSDIILAGGTVTASSYTTINGTVSIADGWIYSDGTNSSSTFADLDKTKTLTPVGASVAMNADGIMTYASKAALDFTGIDGLKAYIVSDFNGTAGTLTLSSVGAVPAGTGLLLKGTAGATFELPFAANATAPAQNYLVGVTDATTVVPVTTSTNTNFILANGKHGIDWYTLSQAGAIGANKAYLSLPTASLSSPAAGFTWVYDGETTGIRPTPGPSLYGGEWYDLSGRKLDSKPTQKGLYIHNGKKVVVK